MDHQVINCLRAQSRQQPAVEIPHQKAPRPVTVGSPVGRIEGPNQKRPLETQQVYTRAQGGMGQRQGQVRPMNAKEF